MSGKMEVVIRTPVSLYRYLLRSVSLLPKDAQHYYKHRIRQEFHSYSDETDSERIEQIIQQTIKDAKWILEKYQQK